MSGATVQVLRERVQAVSRSPFVGADVRAALGALVDVIEMQDQQIRGLLAGHRVLSMEMQDVREAHKGQGCEGCEGCGGCGGKGGA